MENEEERVDSISDETETLDQKEHSKNETENFEFNDDPHSQRSHLFDVFNIILIIHKGQGK